MFQKYLAISFCLIAATASKPAQIRCNSVDCRRDVLGRLATQLVSCMRSLGLFPDKTKGKSTPRSQRPPTDTSLGFVAHCMFLRVSSQSKNRNMEARVHIQNPTPLTVRYVGAAPRSQAAMSSRKSLQIYNTPVRPNISSQHQH